MKVSDVFAVGKIFDLDCKAHIALYKSKKYGNLKVTQVSLEHNHRVDKISYDLQKTNLSTEDLKMVKDLAGAQLKPSKIKRVLKQKSKVVTHKKLENLIDKLATDDSEKSEEESFEEFLTNIESDGGIIEYEDDPDGTVKSFFITSNRMKEAFKSSNLPVVQLDTSFDFEKAKYKVAAFCYLDANTNKTEIAAFCFPSQETASSVKFSLQCFTRICVWRVFIFLVE